MSLFQDFYNIFLFYYYLLSLFLFFTFFSFFYYFICLFFYIYLLLFFWIHLIIYLLNLNFFDIQYLTSLFFIFFSFKLKFINIIYIEIYQYFFKACLKEFEFEKKKKTDQIFYRICFGLIFNIIVFLFEIKFFLISSIFKF